MPEDSYQEKGIDRAATFLSRSMPLPVDVDIEGVDEGDFDGSDDSVPLFLQLIIAHIRHYRSQQVA